MMQLSSVVKMLSYFLNGSGIMNIYTYIKHSL